MDRDKLWVGVMMVHGELMMMRGPGQRDLRGWCRGSKLVRLGRPTGSRPPTMPCRAGFDVTLDALARQPARDLAHLASAWWWGC